MEVPLWNNVKVTRDESLLNSPLLKSFGCFNVGDGEPFSYHDIAKMCGIENINAGRILGRIEKHINYTLIHEKKEGPAAHTSNWLVICDHKNKLVPISESNVKSNYMSLILDKFVSPRGK